jgi:DNA-binding response OmpR family regulator
MKDNGIPTDALESGKRKVLIVDDDVDLVDLLVDVFERDGRFDIRTANNGFDAGMLVKEFQPDLVVLDVMLPDINGKEVCQRVRSDPSMPDVRIICISGMVEQDKVQDLKDAGANDFMQKPFTVEALLDRSCGMLDMEPVTSGR